MTHHMSVQSRHACCEREQQDTQHTSKLLLHLQLAKHDCKSCWISINTHLQQWPTHSSGSRCEAPGCKLGDDAATSGVPLCVFACVHISVSVCMHACMCEGFAGGKLRGQAAWKRKACNERHKAAGTDLPKSCRARVPIFWQQIRHCSTTLNTIAPQ